LDKLAISFRLCAIEFARLVPAENINKTGVSCFFRRFIFGDLPKGEMFFCKLKFFRQRLLSFFHPKARNNNFALLKKTN